MKRSDQDISGDQTVNTDGGFAAALGQLESAHVRPEVRLSAMAAPQRIATNAHAISGDALVDDNEIGTGRFVLLHEPDGNQSWAGTMRCVVFARADVDQEMAVDPALSSVAWSWLTEALATAGAQDDLIAGTTTIVRSDSFGQMAEEEESSQLELRASWTPRSGLAGHLEAWAELLCAVAGIPDLAAGVASIEHKRSRQ